jgi:hypothetical protein
MGILGAVGTFGEVVELLADVAPGALPEGRREPLMKSWDLENAGSLLTQEWSGYYVEDTPKGVVYYDQHGTIVDKETALQATRPNPMRSRYSYTEDGRLIPSPTLPEPDPPLPTPPRNPRGPGHDPTRHVNSGLYLSPRLQ